MNTGVDFVSNRDLTGALPASLGDLGPALKRLDLNGNQISKLPTELGALTGLEVLVLSRNAITSVPAELGALTGLEVLVLSENAITSVPAELGALTGLTRLFLTDNQLTGVPAEFRTVDPSTLCLFDGNPSFSCANVGAGTSCCTSSNCGDTTTCYTEE